MNKEEDIFPFA